MNSSGHILVVDDELKVRRLLRRCLQGKGLAVSETKDGAEMRIRLERDVISLITLDLNLGKENGLDLSRGARKQRKLPIIRLPGRGMLSTGWSASRLGLTTTWPSRSSFESLLPGCEL